MSGCDAVCRVFGAGARSKVRIAVPRVAPVPARTAGGEPRQKRVGPRCAHPSGGFSWTTKSGSERPRGHQASVASFRRPPCRRATPSRSAHPPPQANRMEEPPPRASPARSRCTRSRHGLPNDAGLRATARHDPNRPARSARQPALQPRTLSTLASNCKGTHSTHRVQNVPKRPPPVLPT